MASLLPDSCSRSNLAETQGSATKDTAKDEYNALFACFNSILDQIASHSITLSDLTEIIEQRALFAFNHACTGMRIDFETGLSKIQEMNDGNLTAKEREERDILLAALDNLVDFSTVSQYQMLKEMLGYVGEEEVEDEDELEAIFNKYNLTYATVENHDIEYALGIAAAWITISDLSTLTFMTQGDERVRDSHRALEGLTFPKREFPEWLIPPVDWACRCYLVSGGNSITGESSFPGDLKSIVNPVFSKSVAKKGPIFSSDHPYFMVSSEHVKELESIAKSIKSKILRHGDQK